MTKLLEYVEIDLPFCARTYSVGLCSAALGVTGEKKCFNTLATCQDRPNFLDVPVTYRFGFDAGWLPPSIDCIPNLMAVNITPGIISLGEDLGVRSSVAVTFKDHRHSDTGPGFDKYRSDRAYNPVQQGTMWGKFRQRHKFMRGRPLRVIRGELGQAIEEMETRHFVIESFSGPSADGVFVIVAKDALKLADKDRAVAPKPSNGYLAAGILAADNAATLQPAGIGNAEYPASGELNIGGSEIATFTRVNDNLTFTARGLKGTVRQDHDAESRCQLVLNYVGEDPGDILYDLFVNYAGMDPTTLPIGSWNAETASYLQRTLTATIPEPTGVGVLAAEIVQQAALALWWDDVARLVQLQVLRAITTDATAYDEETIKEGSFQVQDQPDKRVSQVWTYYGQVNPLKPLDEVENYRSVRFKIDAQSESDYGSPAIKTIFSRWIPAFGSQIADRVNDILIARYKNAPRQMTFDIFKTHPVLPELGRGYQVGSWTLQTDEGELETVPAQVVSLIPGKTSLRAVAEEVRFDGVTVDNPDDRVLTIDANSLNINLRTIHDSIYPEITDPTGKTLTVYINSGLYIGSLNRNGLSLNVGSWVPGLPITLVIFGTVQGAGGRGAGYPGAVGEDGGTAIYTRYPISIDNQGAIYGGGGGGGSLSLSFGYLAGGGGAGTNIGQKGAGSSTNIPGFNVVDATKTTGGWVETPDGSIKGGLGGGPGLPGLSPISGSEDQPPGAAGVAIDGVSYVTFINGGTRAGPEIN